MWREAEVETCTGPEAIAKVKAKAAQCPTIAEPFRSAIDSIPESASFLVTQMRYWVTAPWDNRNGRVTLIGDAAHSLLPGELFEDYHGSFDIFLLSSLIWPLSARGQGLNQGIEDVNLLVSEFEELAGRTGSRTVKDALKLYEEDVFVRSRVATMDSLEDTKSLTATKGTAESMSETRQAKMGFVKVSGQ